MLEIETIKLKCLRLGTSGGGVKASCLVAEQAMEIPHVQASKYFVFANSTNLFLV